MSNELSVRLRGVGNALICFFLLITYPCFVITILRSTMYGSKIGVILFFLCNCYFGYGLGSIDSHTENNAYTANSETANFLYEQLFQKARLSAVNKTVQERLTELLPYFRIYRPAGVGPFPVVIFVPGCTGTTFSHEMDWVHFYNYYGVALLVLDSYSGRNVTWEAVCALDLMTPWEQVGDIIAALAYVRTLKFIDVDKIILNGFSQGAISIWFTLIYGTVSQAPIGLNEWPLLALNGVKLVYLFYASCYNSWDQDILVTSFIGTADQYVDYRECEQFSVNNPALKERYHLSVFENSTHTFDHFSPNSQNVEAGSLFDPEATAAARRIILHQLSRVLQTGY